MISQENDVPPQIEDEDMSLEFFERRQIEQQELIDGVAQIEALNPVRRPSHGTYVRLDMHLKNNEKMEELIQSPSAFLTLPPKNREQITLFKSQTVLKECLDKTNTVSAVQEFPMVCNICTYAFTSAEVSANQMLSLQCSSEACFYHNFVHLECLNTKFLRNTLDIAQSPRNVSAGRDGPTTNAWVSQCVIDNNSTRCFLRCKDSYIKSISTILTATEVFSQRFVLDQQATLCPWCKTDNMSTSHFSQCNGISDYKTNNSDANIDLIKLMTDYLSLDFATFSPFFNFLQIRNEQTINDFTIALSQNETCKISTNTAPFKTTQVKIIFKSIQSICEEVFKFSAKKIDFLQMQANTKKHLGAILRSQNTTFHALCESNGSCILTLFEDKNYLTCLKNGLLLAKELTPSCDYPLLVCVTNALNRLKIEGFYANQPTKKDILHKVALYFNYVNAKKDTVDRNIVFAEGNNVYLSTNVHTLAKQFYFSMQSLSYQTSVVKQTFSQPPPLPHSQTCTMPPPLHLLKITFFSTK